MSSWLGWRFGGCLFGRLVVGLLVWLLAFWFEQLGWQLLADAVGLSCWFVGGLGGGLVGFCLSGCQLLGCWLVCAAESLEFAHRDAAAALVVRVLQTMTRVMNSCCRAVDLFCRREQFSNTARVLVLRRLRLTAFQFAKAALFDSRVVTTIESLSVCACLRQGANYAAFAFERR